MIGKPSEECQLRRHDLCNGLVMAGFKQPCTCDCHTDIILSEEV
jgi:hypothetical protein